MSQAVDSPVVVLFEDRPKQGMVFQLNLGIYLDARVTVAASLDDLGAALARKDGVQLVVVRGHFQGLPFTKKVTDFLAANNAKAPVIALGDDQAIGGAIAIPTENEVKPMLQAAAKVLGITAQMMVSKARPDKYDIAAEFLNLLFTCPCDVFDRKGEKLEKVFSAGEVVPRAKIAKFAKEKRTFVVASIQRLKLVNAVTEQALRAAEELASDKLPETKKIAILSASADMVAAQFQHAGMDEETVKLANASIKAVEKIAESASNVGNLVKQLLDAQGGYRYAHCQLITFLGFHVIKMMGWWGDDQRAILSQASFYHDISLNTDEYARVASAKDAAALAKGDAEVEELLMAHAQLAARELQTAPEISPEVIRVVIQHHGSPTGRGFATDIAKLDNLAKTFIISEAWCDYLMEIATSDAKADPEKRIKELKEIYKDDVSQQIIETFRYLDPDQFAQDFMKAEEVDFAASLLSGGGGREADSVVIVPPSKKEKEEETLVKGAKGEKEKSTKVAGVTQHTKDEEILVKGDAAAKADDEKILVGGVGGKDEPEKKSEVNAAKLEGSAAFAKRDKVDNTKGKKAKASPQEVEALIKAGRAVPGEEGEQVFVADESSADPGTLLEGVTEVRKDEEILVKGQEPEEELARTLEGVTEVRNDEKILVKGEDSEEEMKRKLEGVTDVRNDEKIVVKSDPAKSIVDKSITRFRQEAPDKEKEMKVKALAGHSDLMKAALGGDVAKINELLAESTLTLKKTDAEGRVALHYAAMGGKVESLKALLDKGANLKTLDSKRRSPLFFAALYKQNEAFDFLLSQGANIAQQAMGGMTIAMIGAFSGNMHILKTAVEKGVRIDTKDHAGKTAVDHAKASKNAECLAYLEAQLAASKSAAPAKPGTKPPKAA